MFKDLSTYDQIIALRQFFAFFKNFDPRQSM